jgi:hypothetical protein
VKGKNRNLNLLHDDCATVAARVMKRLSGYAGRQAVRVLDTGTVSILRMSEVGNAHESIVGYYTRDVTLEDIEADLLARLREITQAA